MVVLSLALFVPRVTTNHHHVSVAANHATPVANLLDARANLHFLLSCRPRTREPGPFLLSTRLLVAIDDAATGQVIGAQLHNHAILRENSDVVLAHLA